METKILELTKERDDLFQAQRKLVEDATAEKRGMNDTESAKFQELESKYGEIDKQLKPMIAMRDRQIRHAQFTQPGQPAEPAPRTTPADPEHTPPEGGAARGFKRFGEMVQAVCVAGRRGGGPVDERLAPDGGREVRAIGETRTDATTFSSTFAGADGGFLTQDEHSKQILALALGEGSLMARTMQIPTSANTMVIPKDETAPWDTAGTVIEVKQEGGALTQRKVALKEERIELHTYGSLAPVSSELMEDAAALGAFIQAAISRKMAFRLNNDIVAGNGAGEMRGIINSPALISASRSAANVVTAADILAVYGRRIDPLATDEMVFLIHPNVENQLLNAHILGTSSDQFVYVPPGGWSQRPFGTIFGMPVIRTQACKDLGTPGDFILANLSNYITLQKQGGGRFETSIHLWFDQGLTAIRFLMRVGGQAWLSAAVADLNGSTTRSHYVTLAAG